MAAPDHVGYVPGIVADGVARPVAPGAALAHDLYRANALLVVSAARPLAAGASVEYVELTAPTASEGGGGCGYLPVSTRLLNCSTVVSGTVAEASALTASLTPLRV